MARILVVDDSRVVREMLRRVLEEANYEVIEASSGKEAMKIIEEDPPDLVILDIIMDDVGGFEVLKWIRARDDVIQLPVLLLTSQSATENHVKGLNLGANDYITKPFEDPVLLARVKNFLKIRRLEKMLFEKAVTDELTGVYNRRFLFKRFQEEFSEAIRHDKPLSVSILDIDHFKRINDTYGHNCGDFVLRKIAKEIKNSVRLEDVFGRYGGEEFLIILPFTNKQDALHQAERLRKRIAEMKIPWKGENISVTVSIGIAGIPDDPASSEEELLKIADYRLYRAKEKGRNKVEWEDSVKLGVT